MTPLIDKNTRLVVQGITGSAGAFHAKNCMDFGTNVVAGVTPGKGGQLFEGKVPVFDTVAEAKKSNARYSKDYYSILKALGITNRSPVETEITLMDTWLKTYGFSIAIIQEACTRTVLQTGQASFQYTDKILEGWKKKQVKTLEDIQALDAEHKKRKQDKKQSKPAAPASGNRFNNFQQREYNFDEYEKRLLNQ